MRKGLRKQLSEKWISVGKTKVLPILTSAEQIISKEQTEDDNAERKKAAADPVHEQHADRDPE